MKYLEIDEFGKYLVLRKMDIPKNDFYTAIRCLPTETNSLQNNLYNLFCKYGSPMETVFEQYKVCYPDTMYSLVDFLSYFFSIKKEIIDDFLSNKKDNEFCFYVDNVLINGYKETFLLNSDRELDECVTTFQARFKEAIKDL